MAGIECYARGCGTSSAGEIDLHIGGDTMIVLLLCRKHYRQAWATRQIGVWGGSGVDRPEEPGHHNDDVAIGGVFAESPDHPGRVGYGK